MNLKNFDNAITITDNKGLKRTNDPTVFSLHRYFVMIFFACFNNISLGSFAA